MNVSFDSTFATAVPPVLSAEPESLTASIANGTTVTVTSASSQFVGLAISQIRYRRVCVPGGVPVATLIDPFGAYSETPAAVDESAESVTVPVVAGAPLSVSLASTLATVV